MNDERIERALRQGPPDEPAYLPSGVRGASAVPVRSAGRRRPTLVRWASGGLQIATASIVAVALLAVIFLLRGQQSEVAATPSSSPSNPTASVAADHLLNTVRANGFIRFAIRPDFPQAAVPGLEGFDLDVAKELAQRLGLAEHRVQLAAGEILGSGGADSWDLGLPSALVTAEAATRLATTNAYYYWPVYLVAPKATTANLATDLDGQRHLRDRGLIRRGVVERPSRSSSGMAATPPASPVVRTEATDWACLDALTNGAVDALVTSTLSDSDLAARPTLRTVGGPLFIEPRTMVAARAGLDPSALLSTIDDALGAMRSDGTLADLSATASAAAT